MPPEFTRRNLESLVGHPVHADGFFVARQNKRSGRHSPALRDSWRGSFEPQRAQRSQRVSKPRIMRRASDCKTSLRRFLIAVLPRLPLCASCSSWFPCSSKKTNLRRRGPDRRGRNRRGRPSRIADRPQRKRQTDSDRPRRPCRFAGTSKRQAQPCPAGLSRNGGITVRDLPPSHQGTKKDSTDQKVSQIGAGQSKVPGTNSDLVPDTFVTLQSWCHGCSVTHGRRRPSALSWQQTSKGSLFCVTPVASSCVSFCRFCWPRS
jgi:hypothetical protein